MDLIDVHSILQRINELKIGLWIAYCRQNFNDINPRGIVRRGTRACAGSVPPALAASAGSCSTRTRSTSPARSLCHSGSTSSSGRWRHSTLQNSTQKGHVRLAVRKRWSIIDWSIDMGLTDLYYCIHKPNQKLIRCVSAKSKAQKASMRIGRPLRMRVRAFAHRPVQPIEQRTHALERVPNG